MIPKFGALAVSLVLAGTAAAHHGFGTFDMGNEIELTGVVTRVDFVNPHSWLYLDVTTSDGALVAYRCEMRAATVLRRSGWSADMFTLGERVRITGSPDRNDPNSCYMSTIFFADGSTMNRYGQREQPAVAVVRWEDRPPRMANGDLNISGDWAPEQLVMTDPRGQSGPLVPLSVAQTIEPGEAPQGRAGGGGGGGAAERPQPTEAGAAAAEGYQTYGPMNPRMNCQTTSILFDWTFDGPVNRITQHDGYITLQYGQLGFERTIHMIDAHPETIVPSRSGHSIGRWEDDVLIVDTIGFAPGVLSGSLMHSGEMHVVERFSFDPERRALTRTYVAEDPLYFTGQFAGSDTIFPADLPFAPDPCTELTFVDFSLEGQPAGTAPLAPSRPWWRFWN
jgi:hypothetical protein